MAVRPPKRLKMAISVIKETILHSFTPFKIWKDIEIASLDQKLKGLYRVGGFCLLVKLHGKGSACSLQSRLVTAFIGHICLIEPKGSIGHVSY